MMKAACRGWRWEGGGGLEKTSKRSAFHKSSPRRTEIEQRRKGRQGAVTVVLESLQGHSHPRVASWVTASCVWTKEAPRAIQQALGKSNLSKSYIPRLNRRGFHDSKTCFKLLTMVTGNELLLLWVEKRFDLISWSVRLVTNYLHSLFPMLHPLVENKYNYLSLPVTAKLGSYWETETFNTWNVLWWRYSLNKVNIGCIHWSQSLAFPRNSYLSSLRQHSHWRDRFYWLIDSF